MPPASDSPQIVWYATLREPSGYADEARTFLLALDEAGHPAAAREPFEVFADAGLTGRQRRVVDEAIARRIPESGYVAVYHLVPRPEHGNKPGAANVARTMFESDSLPARFKARLLEVDQVWVPTEFNVETFTRGGIPRDRIRVLPETLDFELFDPSQTAPLELDGLRSFTFLTNFDFTDRKGWELLIDGWAKAFAPDDDVCLLLKCLSVHATSGEEVRRRIDQHLDGRATAPIVLDIDVLPIADMPRLYAAADAFVMASRGEGWGRPYMEAMAMGLPTIGSRWSGNLAFMNDANSWLVDGCLVDIPESAQRHTPLYVGHRWFDPDLDSLVAAMREVRAGGQAVARRTAGARDELIDRFGPGPVGARLLELSVEAAERWQARSKVSFACAWRGDFGSGHSLSVVNDGIVGELERAGRPVRQLVAESFSIRADGVGVASHWPPSFVAPTTGPFVLYQPWEFGRVPVEWVEAIRLGVDEVWAPSSFVCDAYVASGVAEELVHVVPNGVDCERFAPDGEAWPLATAKGTVFLFVGGTIHRKGIDVLLEAYSRAFTADDDVCLVVKSFGGSTFYRGQTAEALIEGFRALPGQPEIVLLDDEVPYDRLPSLYRAADVLVQPYRGEGFCLPALEALACGVPVIVTAGGPTDEFADESCGWRIASERSPMAADAFDDTSLALAPGAFMLEPSVDSLVDAFRSAADPAERARRAAVARAHAEPFAWKHAAAKAQARLEALADRTPVRGVKPALVPDSGAFLFYAPADWSREETWVPALHAYLEAFSVTDSVTLVLPARQVEAATALVEAELGGSASVPDIALADPDELGLAALELAAGAAICSPGTVAPRARLVLPADAQALRAAAGLPARVPAAV